MDVELGLVIAFCTVLVLGSITAAVIVHMINNKPGSGSKKKCDVDCGDHGTCDKSTGRCKCVSPYTGDDCSSKGGGQSGCKTSVDCNNHGTCSDGSCDCKSGWTGETCSEQVEMKTCQSCPQDSKGWLKPPACTGLAPTPWHIASPSPTKTANAACSSKLCFPNKDRKGSTGNCGCINTGASKGDCDQRHQGSWCSHDTGKCNAYSVNAGAPCCKPAPVLPVPTPSPLPTCDIVKKGQGGHHAEPSPIKKLDRWCAQKFHKGYCEPAKGSCRNTGTKCCTSPIPPIS